MGEYERTAAVALNAYIGPITAGYLAKVDGDLAKTGYGARLQITQCGGTISVVKARQATLLTLDSGPAAGVVGSQFLARYLAAEQQEPANVITTDMGGTSFDVGVIHQGVAASSYRATVNQYEYFLPKVDIQAIGSGGGSKAWIDKVTSGLKVGPDSAWAAPGPVCYGRGGAVPTVTDADLVLGYLDPDNFAGGAMKLDRAAAAAAIEALGAELDLGLETCASGIAKIVEFQMADLICKVTIQKGFDPSDFTLYAFGGAGPMHAGIFARELGIAKVVVPQRETASVWRAFGAPVADILHVYERIEIMTSPFDVGRIEAILAKLKAEGLAQLAREGRPRRSRRPPASRKPRSATVRRCCPAIAFRGRPLWRPIRPMSCCTWVKAWLWTATAILRSTWPSGPRREPDHDQTQRDAGRDLRRRHLWLCPA